MAATQILGILVFGCDGDLLRCSPEAVRLTGYEFAQVANLQAWCRMMFQEPEDRGLAAAAIERASRNRTGTTGASEFSAAFVTRSGHRKRGHFTVVSTGLAGLQAAELLISILEQAPSATDSASGAEPGAGDVLGRSLDRIAEARRELIAKAEARQQQILAASNQLREHPDSASRLWDALFQEAFSLVEIRELVDVIRDAADAVRQASGTSLRCADSERPLKGVPLGRPVALPLGLGLHELERFWILSTLSAVHGNRSQCAAQLGIALRTVRNKLRSYKTDGFRIPLPGQPRGQRVTVKTRTAKVKFQANDPAASSF